jgi:hypothetical protein
MATKPPATPDPGPARSKRAAARKGRVVRELAQSTLLAAGLAAAQFGTPEIDTRFHLFDPTLLDRLRAPITRYHE